MDTKTFAAELRKWWSFDDRQMHTHSWHSREDFIERKLPELLAAANAENARLLREALENAEQFLDLYVNGASSIEDGKHTLAHVSGALTAGQGEGT